MRVPGAFVVAFYAWAEERWHAVGSAMADVTAEDCGLCRALLVVYIRQIMGAK